MTSLLSYVSLNHVPLCTISRHHSSCSDMVVCLQLQIDWREELSDFVFIIYMGVEPLFHWGLINDSVGENKPQWVSKQVIQTAIV